MHVTEPKQPCLAGTQSRLQGCCYAWLLLLMHVYQVVWNACHVRHCALLGAAGEMLHMAEPFLEKNVHPTVIVRGYVKALEDAIKIVDELSFPIDTNDKTQMLKIVNSCIGTKFTNQFGNLMAVCRCIQPTRC